MPIDPSIPLGVQAPQSPLSSLQQPLQAAQGLLALRGNQMQLNANQAISQAYQQSVNPDGTVDFNKLQALASQNGAGAFLPQFMGQIAQQRNQQLQYDTGKLDLALKQQQGIRGMIGSLAVDPRTGKEDMSSAIAGQISDAVSSGLLPLDQGLREIKSIPSDPGAQASWIQNHLINSLSGEAKIHALMPQIQTVNSGGQTNIVATNPLTGAPTITGSIANTLTPGESAQRIAAVGTDGTPGTIPLGSTVPGAAGGYSGRYPQGGQNGTPNGFVATGMSPAAQSASTAQGATSNAAAQTLHDAAGDAPMRINLLNTARDVLSNIQTGPGTDWRNTLASTLQSTPAVGNLLNAMGVTDPSKIASYDEFKKILTNYASSVSGSLGTGTDARLNAAVTGNANPGISKMANDDILVKTLAAEKMRAAQDYAFQNSGQTTDKFNQWQSQWNKNVDPQAFVYNEMTPVQRAALRSRLGTQGVAKLQANFNALVSQGLITPNAPASQAPAAAAPAAPVPASGVPQ